MPAATTLSDSWFEVADARVALLPTVRAQAQSWRGQHWVLLEDAYANRFFRVTRTAWTFLRRLSLKHSVNEVWRGFAEDHPDDLPGQDEVIRLLSQLHVAGLLQFGGPAAGEAIFERASAQRRREGWARWMAFLFVRIPLFSPDRALDAIRPLIRACTGRAAGLVWLMVVIAGALAAFEQRGALSSAGQGLLSLSNLPWLYLALALVKVLHELAHAFVCKRYGGHVPVFGLMFLVLTPLPYVDASTSWGLRGKWQRAYVGAAGMLAELFLAALGALVWAGTGDGLVNSLAFNVMVVGSVSSLLFNGNPLLRFDAYYILSDLIELPNLYQKAQAQWLHYGSRFILGQHDAVEPAADGYERGWYIGYGALAFLYRLLVTATVLIFVTDQWFAVGVLLLVTTAVAMLVLPLRKLLMHLAGPALRRRRLRALAGLAAFCGVVFGLVAVLPLPHAVRLPGVLEAHRSTPMYARTAGLIAELPVQHGQRLKAGELIARLSNPDLEHALQAAGLQLAEHEALLRQALLRSPAEVAPLQTRIEVLRERRSELQVMADQLVVRAAQDGEWVAPALHERRGAWLERGQPIGELIDRSRWRFSAVLPQSQAAELFGQPAARGELRLMSEVGSTLPVAQLRLVPYQRQRLVSPVLGFGGGGEVAVRPDDASGTLASEAFFEILAEPEDPALVGVVAYHGLSGVLRVPVEARPLWARARAALQQLLQQRYSL